MRKIPKNWVKAESHRVGLPGKPGPVGWPRPPWCAANGEHHFRVVVEDEEGKRHYYLYLKAKKVEMVKRAWPKVIEVTDLVEEQEAKMALTI